MQTLFTSFIGLKVPTQNGVEGGKGGEEALGRYGGG